MPKGVYGRTKEHNPWLGKKHSEKTKKKISESKKKQNLIREKSPHWQGGRKIHPKGYILIYIPQHPFSRKSGYILEHRLVVEKQIGRYLKPSEKCHHLGQRDDNRPHMLMAFKNTDAHNRFEHNFKVKPSEIIFDGRNEVLILAWVQDIS